MPIENPTCPHFGVCGGCQHQDKAQSDYLNLKRQMVVDALAAYGVAAQVMEPVTVPPHSRRRITLHARITKDGDVILGYKQRKSWTVVDVRECPIAHPSLVALVPGLRQLAEPLCEIPKAAPSLHLTMTDTGIDLNITGVPRGISQAVTNHIVDHAVAADIARVSIGGRVIMETRVPVVSFDDIPVTIPPGGFLQAVPKAEGAMRNLVMAGIGKAKHVADLFCGAGCFTLPMVRTAQVYAADSAQSSVQALADAAKHTQGLKPIQTEARDLFKHPLTAKQLNAFDAVVLNPPRAGAKGQVGQLSKSKLKTIVYVSCNPQTFARDAAVLTQAGYSLDPITPIDQFLWADHVEVVGKFFK